MKYITWHTKYRLLTWSMTKKKKIVQTLGYVASAQVPMIMTFDEVHAQFVANHLGSALERAYEVIDLFGDMDEDFNPFGEEG